MVTYDQKLPQGGFKKAYLCDKCLPGITDEEEECYKQKRHGIFFDKCVVLRVHIFVTQIKQFYGKPNIA
jgi:hypothetical protein